MKISSNRAHPWFGTDSASQINFPKSIASTLQGELRFWLLLKPYKRQHNEVYSEDEDIRRVTSFSPRSKRLLNRPDNRSDYDSDKVSSSQVFYRPQRSCEGYVFTPVCLSTVGGCLFPGFVCFQWGFVLPRGGVCLSACWDTTPSPQQMATAADGTHPTGKHSCIESGFSFCSNRRIHEHWHYIITTRQRSCWKVMFPFMSACSQRGKGHT